MNIKTTYENLIAAKMQQVPIPDMADAIWASIELQLDAEPLTDGEDNNAPSKKTQGKDGSDFGFKPYFFIVIALIIVAVVWLSFSKNKKNKILKKIPDTLINRSPFENTNDSTQTILFPKQKNKPSSMPIIIPNNKKPVKVIDSAKIKIDTLNNSPQIFVPIKDTATVISPSFVDTITTSPPVKKPKGVKGISNADYKISGSKKDSVKKNN